MRIPLKPQRRSACPAWSVHALALAAAGLWATGATAAPSRHAWTDWISDSGGVEGVIALKDDNFSVRYRGPYHSAVLSATFQEMHSATFTNSVIDNAPPNTDVINLQGGPGQGEISFSQALINPVMAILSLGLRTNDNRYFPAEMVFADGVEFEILNSSRSFYGYGGPLTKNGQTLRGLESAGSIRFIGAYNRIAWTTPLQEKEFSTGPIGGSWHINVGAPCESIDIGRGPLLAAATVFKGCNATNASNAWRQDAALEVLGSYRNEGRHTLAADLTLAATSIYANRGQVVIEAGRTLNAGAKSYTDVGSTQVFGTLNLNSASLQLAGVLQVKAGGRLNVSGSDFASLGGDIRIDGEGASMRVLAPTTGYGAITLGPQASFELGTGVAMQLTASARLLVNGSGANLYNNGELTLLAGATLNINDGQLRNNSYLRAESGAQVYVNGGRLDNVLGGHLLSNDQIGVGGYAVAARLTNAGTIALTERGHLSIFDRGSFEQQAGGLLVGAAGSMVEVTAGGKATLAGKTVLNGSLMIEALARVDVANGGNFTHRMQPGSTGINRGELVNAGFATLGGSLGASTWLNEGQLTNHNFLLVEVGTTLANTGTIINHAFLQVDGVLAMHAGGQFVQFGGDLTVNGTLTGGRIVSGDPLVIANGLLGGHGSIVGDVVMLGGVTAPGNSPGTLRVMGDMVLGKGSTLALEMARDGRHDQLLIDGRLSFEPGASVRLSFLGGAPDVDQTFSVLSVGTGGVSLDTARLEIDHPTLQSTAYAPGDGRTLALAFQDASAQRFDRSDPWGTWHFDAGQTHYADTDLGRHADVWVGGTLGLRATAALQLNLGVVVAPGGRLLNSGQLDTGLRLVNEGETINRQTLIALELQNRGTFINRGDLVLGSVALGTGRLANQGSFQHLAGRLILVDLGGGPVVVDNAAGAELRLAGGQEGRMALTNQGRVIVDRGGVLLASTVQQPAGELRVDGDLTADLTQVRGGVLAGTGVLRGAVQVDDGALDKLGLTIGTRLRPGLAGPGGDQALRFVGPVHLGKVYQGVLVEIDIASAEAFGQLSFRDALTVDEGSHLQFVLVDGFEPVQGLRLTVLRFDPERTGTEGLGALLSTAEVWQRSAAGDVPWRGGSWGFDWQEGYIDLQLTPAPVPEPAAWGLLAGGLALLQGLAWRRRRAQGAAA